MTRRRQWTLLRPVAQRNHVERTFVIDRHYVLLLIDGFHGSVRQFIGKPAMRDKSPSAVVDCQRVSLQLPETTLREHRPGVTEQLELSHDLRFQRNHFIIILERKVEPSSRRAHAFIKNSIDRTLCDGLHALGRKRAGALLYFSTPPFDLVETQPVERKNHADRIVRSVIHAGHSRRDMQRNFALRDIVKRPKAKLFGYDNRDPVPGRKAAEHTQLHLLLVIA